MRARIIVVHGSRPEALQGAAEAAVEALARTGAEVVRRSAREVESLAAFDSAVICGQLGPDGWADEAVHFIGRHRRDLAHMSVAYCVGLSPEMDADDRASLQRALKFVLDWYNEVRPVRVGFFHLGHRSAREEIMRWAERLKPNFVSPSLESPAGIRPFLEAHPVERQDQSDVPTTGFTRAEQRLSRGESPEGPPSPERGPQSPQA